MTVIIAAGSAFLASIVEGFELLLMILASGRAYGWGPSLGGATFAVFVVGAISIVVGPAILLRVPTQRLEMVAASIMIAYGIWWLTIVLRFYGNPPAKEGSEIVIGAAVKRLQQKGSEIAFASTFSRTLTNVLQIALFALAVGAATRQQVAAASGAVAAVALVATVGLLVQRPVSRASQMILTLVASVVLTSLGAFWLTESFGLHWPLQLVAGFVAMGIFALLVMATLILG
ncbi:MAG TPA: hypothetical protein VKG44_10750 [Candidatus Baltobacteraceae bacterium]|nr:hypothetical protein [Candidatus Baltobacteraceae bacterium]